MAQPVMDAMSLPMMVAGGTILSASSKLKSALGPVSSPVSKEIDAFARPVADIFGLPNTLVQKATASAPRSSGSLGSFGGSNNEPIEEEEGNWMDKIGNFFNRLFGNKKNSKNPPGRNPNAGRAGNFSGGAKGVLDLIAEGESGGSYDIFNTSRGDTPGKATEKTIQWLQDNANGAIGRYQHMPRFIMQRALDAGYTADTLFTPDVQDAITIKMLEGSQYKLNDFLSGTQSAETFAASLAPTWRALPQGPDAAASLGGTRDSTYHDKHRGDNAANRDQGWDNTVASLKSIQAGGSSPTPNLQPSMPTYASHADVPPGVPIYRNSETGKVYKRAGFGFTEIADPTSAGQNIQTAALNNSSATQQPQTNAVIVGATPQRPPVSTVPVNSELLVSSTVQEHSGSSMGNYYGGTNAFSNFGYFT